MSFLPISLVKNAKRVYVVGNGGSYANAMHIVNDLLSQGIKAYTIDGASLSMMANDFGWENALAWWVSTVGEPGDLLIALSGSGRSPNILNAAATARRVGLEVYEEFGYPKGLDMQEAEEAQVRLGHDLYRALRD
jgi:D-sedoheptulose 7-phosphate isomerase